MRVWGGGGRGGRVDAVSPNCKEIVCQVDVQPHVFAERTCRLKSTLRRVKTPRPYVLRRGRNRIIRSSRGYNSSPDTIQTLRGTDAPYVGIIVGAMLPICVPHRNEDGVFAMIIIRERENR